MTKSQKFALEISETRQALTELTETVNGQADGATEEQTTERRSLSEKLTGLEKGLPRRADHRGRGREPGGRHVRPRR